MHQLLDLFYQAFRSLIIIIMIIININNNNKGMIAMKIEIITMLLYFIIFENSREEENISL